ncbi:hypothetical protein [Agromyces sp. GXQ0307]|uniref:hypothetical protein n=1 Tax=Agromyces sp. GXQ0307 TaxID=3377835 RepID=UPI00383A5A1E
MAREEAGHGDGNAFTRFFDRVDRVMTPAFESPRMAPEEPDDRSQSGEKPCPLCGHPMFEHRIDESTSNVLLECPTDVRLPEPAASGPLNEFGMPASEERVEKLRRHERA